MSNATVNAASIFEAYFRALYPQELRDDVAALIAARSLDANPAKNRRLFAELDDTADVFAKLAPRALGRDDLALDFTDASVHRLGTALDRPTRDALIAASKQGDPSSPFVNVVIHGALYVGACIVRAHGGAWGVRRPLWESVVHLSSRAGEGALSPFHWLLKSLGDDEIDKAGLVSRYRHYVERATFEASALPKIVEGAGGRTLPSLKKVRYDTLHKHLRAHLPEMKDLGNDFPSPEEFQDLGFLELELLLLGEGRMLLMHGRGRRGLHLLWLDHRGFSHAAFFPADPGDPHRIAIEGDKLIVRFVQGGAPRVHEMLWWG